MNKQYLVIILFTFILIACAKNDDTNDHIPPVIKNVHFNTNDTIIWNGMVISFNSSLSLNKIDTLVIGKMAYLSGDFSSNKTNALSGYKVIMPIKVKNNAQSEIIDTLYATSSYIYGKTIDSIQKNRLLTIPDSVSITVNKEEGIKTYYPIEGEYKIEIECGDIYGNKSSIPHTIRLLSRETIYNSRSK